MRETTAQSPFLILSTKSFGFTYFKSYFLNGRVLFLFSHSVFVSSEAREELEKRGGRSLTNLALHLHMYLPAVLNFGREIDH